MVVRHFKDIGHKKIVAFVPQFRMKKGKTKDPQVTKVLQLLAGNSLPVQVLQRLVDEQVVCLTPSREVNKIKINCYDDTYMLDYAAQYGGIVVTRDNYKDLANVSQLISLDASSCSLSLSPLDEG